MGPRRPGVHYQIEHQGNFFYILVSEPGKNARRCQSARQRYGAIGLGGNCACEAGWEIDTFAAVGDELVLAVRQDGQQRITTCNLSTRIETDVQFSDPLGSFGVPSSLDRLFPTWPEPGAHAVQLLSESFVSPRSVFEYDLKRKALNLLWQSHVPGYRPQRYGSRRVFATAPDGSRIPISLVFKKPLVRGWPKTDSALRLWLDGRERGPVVRRGAGELVGQRYRLCSGSRAGRRRLGRQWHQAAMGRTKLLSFTDLVQRPDLIAQRYTSRGKLAITGASAGGLLVTGAAMMRPDLFHAVLAKSPMVQVFFPATGLLGSMGTDFGDARENADFDTMVAYSPYDNVRAQAYPHMLFTASQADPRTGSSPAAKFVARLTGRGR